MHSYLEILITIGSLGAMMYGMLKFMLRDIHKDLSELKETSKRSETRIDHLYKLCTDALDQQGKRTDHLYEICIEMLRTRHKG